MYVNMYVYKMRLSFHKTYSIARFWYINIQVQNITYNTMIRS